MVNTQSYKAFDVIIESQLMQTKVSALQVTHTIIKCLSHGL